MLEEYDLLLKGIKNGDYSSYNRLFVLYYCRLCAFVNTIIDDTEASEDVVQELFIRLWTHRHQLTIKQGYVSGYLYKAAQNAAINYLRRENNRRKSLEKMPLIPFTIDRDFLEEEEFREALKKCINELPGRCKEIFLLSRYDGCKQKEIADKLNISVKTIKNHLWKALTYLKSCLEPDNSF